MLECWNVGMLEYWKIEKWELVLRNIFKNCLQIGGKMERKNINRGFKKLRVWQDAISMYVLTWNILKKFPFELKKVVSNCVDASQSISRNIAEGYCRRSLKEYLNHLNYALGSCGELYSCFKSFSQADQISNEEYEKFDALHYKIENELIKLIEILQTRLKNNLWDESFANEAIE